MKLLLSFVVLAFLNGNVMAMDTGDILEEEVVVYQNLQGPYNYTKRLIHDPRKVESFSKKFSFSLPIKEIEVDMNSSGHSLTNKEIGMSEQYIAIDENIIVQTRNIVDCIGISAWRPLNKAVSLKHATKMELREDNHLFKQHFIAPLLEKVKDPSQTVINVVSSYWSSDVIQAIELMQDAGFKISGLSIPDAVLESNDSAHIVYINKETVPQNYLSFKRVPYSAMAIDTRTGKIGFNLQ